MKSVFITSLLLFVMAGALFVFYAPSIEISPVKIIPLQDKKEENVKEKRMSIKQDKIVLGKKIVQKKQKKLKKIKSFQKTKKIQAKKNKTIHSKVFEYKVHEESPVLLGKFLLQQTVTLYIKVGKNPVRGRIRFFSDRIAYQNNEPLTIRLFDPQEKIVLWQHFDENKNWKKEKQKIKNSKKLPSLPIIRPKNGRFPIYKDVDFFCLKEGIYQLRMTAGSFGVTAGIMMSEKIEYGVSFQNGHFMRWEKPNSKVSFIKGASGRKISSDNSSEKKYFVYVPQNAQKFKLSGARVRIKTPKTVYVATFKKPFATKIRQINVVWEVQFAEEKSRFHVVGFPFIMCSSKKFARELKASTVKLKDGSIVSHLFQKKIAEEILPEFLQEKYVGKKEDLIVPLNKNIDVWLENPFKSKELFTYLVNVEKGLRYQNVKPGSGWKLSLGRREFRRTPYVLTIKGSINPYFGNKKIALRTAIAFLRRSMTLTEAEVWPEAMRNSYPANMYFAMAQDDLPAFGLLAPMLPKKVKVLWQGIVRRMIDREVSDYIVTARNQSSHMLVALEYFAIGTKDPVDYEISRSYARRFVESANAPGYFMESGGPCSSYTGMTHWHLGEYLHLSNDPVIKEALRKSYDFFNHTVAPEPDNGEMLGGFNFNHRIGMGFFAEQWRGAKFLAADKLPEVALWKDSILGTNKPDYAKEKERLRETIKEKLKDYLNYNGYGQSSSYEKWDDVENATKGTWPAEQKVDFIRNFGNELISIKRKKYFTSIYIGHPAGKWYVRGAVKLRKPLAEENSDFVVDGHQNITPFVGGGMSLFWTKDYGNSILAANWSPLTHHGLVVKDLDGLRYWEDYQSVTFDLDKKKSLLTIRGRLDKYPVTYKRTYHFLPNYVEVTVEITAEKAVKFKRFYENFPMATGSRKKHGAFVNFPDGRTVNSKSFKILDSKKNGVEIQFKKKHKLTPRMHGMISLWNIVQINRIEVDLKKSLAKGESFSIKYKIKPLKRRK